MFLAAIYPLSERSAVNLMGKVNTGNITGFEEQSVFESSGQNSDLIEEQAEDNYDPMETVDKEERNNQFTKKLKTDQGKRVQTKDYSLYRTFWNIQVKYQSYNFHLQLLVSHRIGS